MEYAIQYEHLVEELVKDERTRWHFKQVREGANAYSLELTDEEFKGFFKLELEDNDVNWMMHKMSVYKVSFVDTLIAYINY